MSDVVQDAFLPSRAPARGELEVELRGRHGTEDGSSAHGTDAIEAGGTLKREPERVGSLPRQRGGYAVAAMPLDSLMPLPPMLILRLASIRGLAQREAEDEDPEATQVNDPDATQVDENATEIDPDATQIDPDALTVMEDDMLPATPVQPSNDVSQHPHAETRVFRSELGSTVAASTSPSEAAEYALGFDGGTLMELVGISQEPHPDPWLEPNLCPHSLGEGCCICLEPFESAAHTLGFEVVKGCACCMKVLHVRCFTAWENTCAASGKRVSCPMCRGRSFWESAAHL